MNPACPRIRVGILAALTFLLAILTAVPVAAQLQTPQAGVAELGLLLRQMDGERRVLMIAAHPDDEDTSLLAVLARGHGARTAYLSLSRGEGGQNLIGPELEEGLGIIRTGELLSARSLDGAEQYFTRAFDFGYSREADETFGHWPRQELLRDVVEVIRRVRPHVVISIFTGTSRDGHGHHQAAGIVSGEAFEAAADPSRFPEQLEAGLEAWAPRKLYRSTRFRGEATTLEVSTGHLDPLLGRSHFQVAMASRSRHRSQDMGTAETPGPRNAGLELDRTRGIEGLVGDSGGLEAPGGAGDSHLFAGIDTTLSGLVVAAGLSNEGAVLDGVERYRQGVNRAVEVLHPYNSGRALPHLQAAGAGLSQALAQVGRGGAGGEESVREQAGLRATGPEVSGGTEPGGTGLGPATSPPARELLRVLEARRELLSEALLLAGSVVVETRTDRARVTPGGTLEVEVLLWNAGAVDWDVTTVNLHVPAGWEAEFLGGPQGAGSAEPLGGGEGSQVGEGSDVGEGSGGSEGSLGGSTGPETVTLEAGTLIRRSFRVRVPADAAPSRLYYLTEPRDGSLYRWPDDPELRGLPGNPPLVEARVELAPDNGQEPVTASVVRPAVHVDVDKALGEVRVPFIVVPPLSVSVDPPRLAWPRHDPTPRTVTARVVHLGGPELEGELRFEAPDGWRVEPSVQPLRLGVGVSEGSFSARLHPPDALESSQPEIVRLRAVAEVRPTGGDGAARGEAPGPLEPAEEPRPSIRIDEGLTLIDYPHIDPVPLFEPAELLVTHTPVRVVEGLRVGYLMGPGDDGLRALRDLGVMVEPLDPEAFRRVDLDHFDAVVLGVRAYETRQDLIAANDRLLDYARGGGTVIVQYNKYEFPDGDFAPYPLAMRRPHDRVTDPDAPVTLLEPDHPLLSSPNPITRADFEGWVQERGLYFLSEWDPRYTPLLEMADPGLEPNRGSLVVARVGDGAYVYTGLALFRQLPQGVPGAFRLLANLVSLSGSDLQDPTPGETP